MTGREALNHANRRLEACGVSDGRAARLLLEGALRCGGAALIPMLVQPMEPQAEEHFLALLRRAESGEPLQYVLGAWDFYGREFRCDSRALIPRADTETLAEAALHAAKRHARPRILDVGCGTGCIGITLKLECPKAQVTLCDISTEALGLAAENAALHRADVRLLQADMLKTLPDGPYDIIVSNPPYINSNDMRTLPRAVIAYEPALALYGGPDGLDYVRALAQAAQESLNTGGSLLIEIGYDQADAAVKILNQALHNARVLMDMAGVCRVVATMKEDLDAGTEAVGEKSPL